MKRIFSGIQPSGTLHLGNYLGALKRFPQYQDEYDCVYSIVDMHALTLDMPPADLRSNITTTAAAMLAAGLDPEKSTIFVQSANPHHAELMWMLSCVSRVGWLERMHHFKDKTGEDAARARVGLYAYPVLMSADILAYNATHVPVASDQNQHLNFAAQTAKSFNSNYEPFFNPPVGLISNIKVMSLQDGNAKMSKSAESDRTRINLTDSNDEIRRKYRKAKAETGKLPDCLEDMLGMGGITRPEAYNLLSIYAGLADIEFEESIKKFAGCGFSELKDALAEQTILEISGIRARMEEHVAKPDKVRKILRAGAEDARKKSAEVVPKIREIMGMG